MTLDKRVLLFVALLLASIAFAVWGALHLDGKKEPRDSPALAPARATAPWWSAEASASYHVPFAVGVPWEHMTSLGACDHFLVELPPGTLNARMELSWSLLGGAGAGGFALVVSTNATTEYHRASQPGLVSAPLAGGEIVLAPWPDGPVVNQDAELRVLAEGEGPDPGALVLEARLFDGSPCRER